MMNQHYMILGFGFSGVGMPVHTDGEKSQMIRSRKHDFTTQEDTGNEDID